MRKMFELTLESLWELIKLIKLKLLNGESINSVEEFFIKCSITSWKKYRESWAFSFPTDIQYPPKLFISNY